MNETSALDQPTLPSISREVTSPRVPQLKTNHSTKTWKSTASLNNQVVSVRGISAPSEQFVGKLLSIHASRKPDDRLEALATVHSTDMAEADSVLLSPSAKYAKRSRYKTRADTYEYKGDIQDKKTSRKRKRRAGSLGNENFHAANVDAERVTLKPNIDKFVFSRSRNSLPLPGQDLPDLTFTKMDYISKLPRKLQPKPAQSGLQEKMEEYIVRREKTEDVTCSAPAATSNNRSLTSKSDLYCSRFATDKSQDTAVHESRNDAIAKELRRIDGGSSWVKDSIDPRVEVFRLPDTNRHASTPVSWSTTPSRKSKPPAQADCSLSGEARLRTCHNHVEPIRQIGQSEPRSTSNGQRQWSEIHHDELTQTLLRKTTENQAVSSDQRAFKKYLSLEDLKRMSKEIRKERSTDCLTIPPQPWQPSPSGRMSASAPSPMQRPSFNLNDVSTLR